MDISIAIHKAFYNHSLVNKLLIVKISLAERTSSSWR